LAIAGHLFFLGKKNPFTAVSDVLGGQFVRLAPAEFELACRVWGASLPLRDLRSAAAAAAPLVWYSGGVEIHLDVEDWFWDCSIILRCGDGEPSVLLLKN